MGATEDFALPALGEEPEPETEADLSSAEAEVQATAEAEPEPETGATPDATPEAPEPDADAGGQRVPVAAVQAERERRRKAEEQRDQLVDLLKQGLLQRPPQPAQDDAPEPEEGSAAWIDHVVQQRIDSRLQDLQQQATKSQQLESLQRFVATHGEEANAALTETDALFKRIQAGDFNACKEFFDLKKKVAQYESPEYQAKQRKKILADAHKAATGASQPPHSAGAEVAAVNEWTPGMSWDVYLAGAKARVLKRT